MISEIILLNDLQHWTPKRVFRTDGVFNIMISANIKIFRGIDKINNINICDYFFATIYVIPWQHNNNDDALFSRYWLIVQNLSHHVFLSSRALSHFIIYYKNYMSSCAQAKPQIVWYEDDAPATTIRRCCRSTPCVASTKHIMMVRGLVQ